ncbi:invasion associated locus B family protein [Rhodospirillaceae bacterium SYSU D60014]|uniref:invasion associated locus B family protein n=1 Tax=Virgifigura deserti TaxID=2268457 RepID=UPI0013C4C838
MKLSPLILSFALCLGVVGPAFGAPQPKSIGQFDDWAAVTFEEEGNLVCYITSEPLDMKGDYTQRGRVYALVTHRPANQSLNVVTFIAGYTYDDGSEVTAEIDDQEFTLFTQDDGAWAVDGDTDKKLVDAMRKGREMVVQGVSSRGTETTDTYSLMGFSKAYGAINEACDVAS